jgi:hypothetical protein
VSASTQNQALCALLFLYRHVLCVTLEELDLVRALRRRKLPIVLSSGPRYEDIRTIMIHVHAVDRGRGVESLLGGF